MWILSQLADPPRLEVRFPDKNLNTGATNRGKIRNLLTIRRRGSNEVHSNPVTEGGSTRKRADPSIGESRQAGEIATLATRTDQMIVD